MRFSSVEKPQFGVGYGLKYGETRTVPQLSEELGIDIAAALNVENFFSGGRARAPWVLAVSAAVKAAPKGQVSTIKVLLRCFADGGANLRQVDYAVPIRSDKDFAATLLNTNVEAVGENLPCPAAVK